MRAGKDVSYLEGTRLGKLPKIPGPGTYKALRKYLRTGEEIIVEIYHKGKGMIRK